MQRWHCAGQNAAKESIPHDQLISRAKLLKKKFERTEIVTIVAITHDDIFATGRTDTAEKSTAISAQSDVYNAGAAGNRDRLRSVRTSIVGNENLAVHAVTSEECLRFHNAPRECLGFVETRHENSQLAGFGFVLRVSRFHQSLQLAHERFSPGAVLAVASSIQLV